MNSVAQALNNKFATSGIYTYSLGNKVDFLDFYIFFHRHKGQIPELVADSTLLTGGNGDWLPKVTIKTVKDFSMDAYFQHVPSNFLYDFH